MSARARVMTRVARRSEVLAKCSESLPGCAGSEYENRFYE